MLVCTYKTVQLDAFTSCGVQAVFMHFTIRRSLYQTFLHVLQLPPELGSLAWVHYIAQWDQGLGFNLRSLHGAQLRRSWARWRGCITCALTPCQFRPVKPQPQDTLRP